MIENNEAMVILLTTPLGKVLKHIIEYMEKNDEKTHTLPIEFSDTKFEIRAEIKGDD